MRARNVRFDSLNPNRQVADQDCHSCIKRRIRCDRTVPGCVKCSSRDLACPGYHAVRLRWDQGVASRGRLAGKSTPVIDKTAPKGNENSVSTCSVETLITSPPTDSQLISSLDGDAPCNDNSSIPDPTQDLHLIKRISSDCLSQNLLHHFSSAVIPRLTWIDLPGSPWRHTILPLTQHSPCLRLSISSLAAAHLSTTSTEDSDQRVRFFQMQNWLRDASLRVLNDKMRLELRSDTQVTSSSSMIEVLTAMLILCYTEAFIPGSSGWALHLRGCRTVINHGNWQAGSVSRNPIESFLLKEVADLSALCNISVFDKESRSNDELVFGSLCDTSIWPFTGLVNDITTIERRRHAGLQNREQLPDMDMQEWHMRAQNAHTSVLSRASTFSEDEGDTRQCFHAVVRTHYHASLIYSYQAFAPTMEVQALVDSSLDSLVHEIQSVLAGPVQTFSHDLFFPCLIAGTECHADRNKQSTIERLFLDSLSKTGLWCNHTALQFLRTLWASCEYQTGMNWIQYARENESQIGTFIAF